MHGDDGYDEWIALDGDEDGNESFYPAPELDDMYEEELAPVEAVVPKEEDPGNVSEELGLPLEEEYGVAVAKKQKTRRR